jgi:hypothetical protein
MADPDPDSQTSESSTFVGFKHSRHYFGETRALDVNLRTYVRGRRWRAHMRVRSKRRSMEILRPILLLLNNTDEYLLYRETSGAFFQPLLCHLMFGTTGSSSKGGVST